MAESNVIGLNRGSDLDEAARLRNMLQDCDALTQGACNTIIAMASAGRQMLELNAGSLERVYHLLCAIESHARGLEGDINAQAELGGAHWIDKTGRAAVARLWEQHRALHGNVQRGESQ